MRNLNQIFLVSRNCFLVKEKRPTEDAEDKVGEPAKILVFILSNQNQNFT